MKDINLSYVTNWPGIGFNKTIRVSRWSMEPGSIHGQLFCFFFTSKREMLHDLLILKFFFFNQASWHERWKGCSTRARDAGWEERDKFTQIYTFYNLLLTWLHYLSWQACLLRLRIYPQLTNRSLTLMQRPGEFTDITIQASCPSICKYFKPQGRFQKYEKARCVLSMHD